MLTDRSRTSIANSETRHLDVTCGLLGDPQSDQSLDALYGLATQAATLAGWLSFDLHDHASAQHYYQVATGLPPTGRTSWLCGQG